MILYAPRACGDNRRTGIERLSAAPTSNVP
jgi:hypothetical protein